MSSTLEITPDASIHVRNEVYYTLPTPSAIKRLTGKEFSAKNLAVYARLCVPGGADDTAQRAKLVDEGRLVASFTMHGRTRVIPVGAKLLFTESEVFFLRAKFPGLAIIASESDQSDNGLIVGLTDERDALLLDNAKALDERTAAKKGEEGAKAALIRSQERVRILEIDAAALKAEAEVAKAAAKKTAKKG